MSDVELDLTAAALATLPVFPLPRVVLFPGAEVPLHLFEPRYRQLTEHCLRTPGRAMAVTRIAPGHEEAQRGDPPFAEVATVGTIVHHEAMLDGTHHILLRTLARVRLDELSGAALPFRLAKAVQLPTQQAGGVAKHDVRALRQCAHMVVQAVRRRHPDFCLGLAELSDTEALIDRIADGCIAHPDTRQAILEAQALPKRLSLVTSALSEVLAHFPHDAWAGSLQA
ncbi:MAG: LON peptidase substrate-binding domain-containing protein [Polyangiales bacterium]